jgi:hypothetical protein
MSAKTENAKKRFREHHSRQVPLGSADPQSPLYAVVEALLDVLPAAQADALADALEARLR